MKSALVLLCILVPGAVAGGATFNDDSGDLVALLGGSQESNVPAGIRDYLDITEVQITETASTLELSLSVLDPAHVDMVDGYAWAVQFDLQGMQYLLQMMQPPYGVALGVPFHAELQSRLIGSSAWIHVDYPELERHATGATAILEKSTLLDADGSPPLEGQEISNVHAWSQDGVSRWNLVGPAALGAALSIQDRAPAEGTFTEVIPLTETDGASAAVHLSSPRPLRASNGEETTHVYQVALRSASEASLDLALQLHDVPATWSSDLPRAAVHLEPGELVQVPVVVSIPFAHEHGNQVRFRLEATDVRGGDKFDLELGVNFLATPQPAGHHNVLWFHTADVSADYFGLWGDGSLTLPYMNALQTDVRSTGENMALTHWDYDSFTNHAWCIPLSPGLQLGLEFSPEEVGLLAARLETTLPASGTLGGALYVVSDRETEGYPTNTVCSPDPAIQVATLEAQALEMDQQSGQDVELAIRATADGHRVPAQVGQQLILQIDFQTDRPSPAPQLADHPVIQAGARMALPLLEYHDAVPDAFIGGPRMDHEGPSRLARAPATTALFPILLDGPSEGWTFDVLGTRPEWASIHAGPDDGRVHLIVDVPSDALDGDVASLIVKASHPRDSDQVAIVAAVVEVDAEQTDDDAIDAASLAGAKRSTPLVSVAYLAAAAVVAGRRR